MAELETFARFTATPAKTQAGASLGASPCLALELTRCGTTLTMCGQH